MRLKLLTFIFLLATVLCFGQGLQRNNLLGLHVIDVDLNEGVTMEQFKTFFVEEVIPEYEEAWLGLQGYLIKSVRGEYKNRFGIIWIFATEPTRDYYFNEDDTMNQRELDNIEKVKPIEEELKKKYGSYTITYMDDWIIQ